MKKLIIGSVVAMSLLVAPAAKAATVEELQAMIAQLTSQLSSLSGGSSAMSSGYTFTSNLTVGSKGDEVMNLQKALGVTPTSGVFGPITKAAVMKFQSSNGISATGYVGPLTRAALNKTSSPVVVVPTTPSTPATPGCPAGAMYNSMTGASCATTSTPSTPAAPTGITTPGVEGTLSATISSSGVKSTVYEGDTMQGILAVKLEAKNSDISIQRVKLDLGNSTKIYNKIYSKIYVTDGSTVLASSDLNSSTVVKDSGEYYITIAGFSTIVPKGGSKILTIKADVYSSIDSGDQTAYTVKFATDGVRGTDGAGIDQYAAGTSISRSVTVSGSLVDSAKINVSTNASNIKASDIVAASGSNNDELDQQTVLLFDLNAEKDDVKMTDLTVNFAKTGTGAATATTAYLYDGSTEVDSAAIDSLSGNAVFSDLEYTVSKDSTKTLTIKTDIRSANGTVANVSASIAQSGITAENSKGDSATVSGSATGEAFSIRNIGPVFTLVSKSISLTGSNTSGTSYSTSTINGLFSVRVKAVGGDIVFGSQASGTQMFAFKVYDSAGSDVTGTLGASTTGFVIPSSGVVDLGSNTFKLQKNNEITLNDVQMTLDGKTAGGVALSGSYSIGINAIRWFSTTAANSSTFMSGKTDWRTATQKP